jgi:hypothetical protein
MGKACIRFKKVDDLALDVLGQTIARVTVEKFIAFYEKAMRAGEESKSERAKPARKKTAGAPKSKPTGKRAAAAR